MLKNNLKISFDNITNEYTVCMKCKNNEFIGNNIFLDSAIKDVIKLKDEYEKDKICKK